MSRRPDRDPVMTLFRIAHRERENISEKEPVSGDVWLEQTMRRIRSLAGEPVRQGFSVLFEQFVWRLTPVTLAMILITSVVFSNFDLIGDAEIFRLFSYESEDVYALLLPE